MQAFLPAPARLLLTYTLSAEQWKILLLLVAEKYHYPSLIMYKGGGHRAMGWAAQAGQVDRPRLYPAGPGWADQAG